ncbi:MAG TPA: hypothetical protein VJW20_06620 [Candidatus Angelobacter sp.]|nr:hypothetical protein [Candidatus Angelobacter sp.]
MPIKTRAEEKVATWIESTKPQRGCPRRIISIQPIMKQPTDQHERNEDKKKPEENPSRGIDPRPEEKEMEVVDLDPGHRQKGNQNQKKDDDLAA